MPEINEGLLDERLAALEAAKAWSPRVVSKLENHIRAADDVDLFRINPCTFAVRKGVGEAETIDLFLHASALGLFVMDWILLCPLCSCVIDSFQALRNLDSHCRCNICHVDFDAALDDQIAVAFTINPDIRRIAYHDPESLSLADYSYRYKAALEGLMPDGAPFTALKEMATAALSRLEPGTTASMDVSVEGGLLRGFSVDYDPGFWLTVDPALPAAEQRISMRCDDTACDPAEGTVAPGRVTFDIINASTRRHVFAILALPPGATLPPLHFAPFLSGKQLLTTQTFRDLFRSEATSHGIGIRDITLLFTDLKGSTALYDRIGDLNAFSLVQQHFDRLQHVTVRHDGAIIKTIGDAVMAAFRTPTDAVRAALEMRAEIASFNSGSPDAKLILKIGLHNGAVIAVTLNDRLDYFGQTVNIAARVQNLADADEIVVSQDVYESAGVPDELAPFAVEPSKTQLRGVEQEFSVFRVSSARMVGQLAVSGTPT